MASRVRTLLDLRVLLALSELSLSVESLSSWGRPAAGFLEASGEQDGQPAGSAGFCVPLENFGSYSAVSLGVGQPQQKFSVVADTGSSAVIVASCDCESCVGLNACYKRAKSSSSAVGTDLEVIMSFGSGDIRAKIVTDVVAVGASSAMMTDGLYEMLDMKMEFSMKLEGILGLGPPPPQESSPEGMPQEKHFMSEAKVNHFSFCLQSSGPGGGALQVAGRQSTTKQIGNVGKTHWGLGFNGISVGEGTGSRMPFCSPFNMEPGQETPCGAIPDSGTTMISAPRKHLAELTTGICDAWPRCAAAATRSHFKAKVAVFMELLMNCNQWVHEGDGLDELPTLHFHITGIDGAEEPIAVSPWSYIIEMPLELYQHHIRQLPGSSGLRPHASLAAEKCAPAFGATKMLSRQNGPVWILGTPFFYEYVIHYNLNPQTISFERSECGTCGSQGEDFIEAGTNNSAGGQGDQNIEAGGSGKGVRRWVRRLSTAPRLPERYHAWHGVL